MSDSCKGIIVCDKHQNSVIVLHPYDKNCPLCLANKQLAAYQETLGMFEEIQKEGDRK
jgi:hypothetical protein